MVLMVKIGNFLRVWTKCLTNGAFHGPGFGRDLSIFDPFTDFMAKKVAPKKAASAKKAATGKTPTPVKKATAAKKAAPGKAPASKKAAPVKKTAPVKENRSGEEISLRKEGYSRKKKLLLRRPLPL